MREGERMAASGPAPFCAAINQSKESPVLLAAAFCSSAHIAVPPRLEPVNQAPRPANQGESHTYRLPRAAAAAPSEAVMALVCMTWDLAQEEQDGQCARRELTPGSAQRSSCQVPGRAAHSHG